MASSGTVSEKQLAVVKEMLEAEKKEIMKEPVVMMATTGGGGGAAEVTVRGKMLNDTLGTNITCYDHKDWSGQPFPSYVTQIAKNRIGNFVHKGVIPDDTHGSKGAVVYTGSNVPGTNVSNSAWVLAWSVPGDGTPNKVYVEAGAKQRYPENSIDWDRIKAKLEESNTSSHDWDESTGCEALAEIGNGNTVPIAAVFNVKSFSR